MSMTAIFSHLVQTSHRQLVQGMSPAFQPFPGEIGVWAMPVDQVPELGAMVHLLDMGDFMSTHIVQDFRWSHNQSPGIGKRPGTGT